VLSKVAPAGSSASTPTHLPAASIVPLPEEKKLKRSLAPVEQPYLLIRRDRHPRRPFRTGLRLSEHVVGRRVASLAKSVSGSRSLATLLSPVGAAAADLSAYVHPHDRAAGVHVHAELAPRRRRELLAGGVVDKRLRGARGVARCDDQPSRATGVARALPHEAAATRSHHRAEVAVDGLERPTRLFERLVGEVAGTSRRVAQARARGPDQPPWVLVPTPSHNYGYQFSNT
jgi:hypothetical protein